MRRKPFNWVLLLGVILWEVVVISLWIWFEVSLSRK